MHPVKELSDLLRKKQQTQKTIGVISKVDGRSFYLIEDGKPRVATALPGDVSLYKAGDRVQLEGGVVVGKVSPRRSKKFYL